MVPVSFAVVMPSVSRLPEQHRLLSFGFTGPSLTSTGTLYRFLSAGEFSIHDDRWFTKPWGINGGSPGARSFKKIYRYSSKDPSNPTVEVLPSKCDYVRVQPNDLLEWVTWGGGGLGDPTTRPTHIVAMEVARKLVTVKGARENYGVVVDGSTFEVDDEATRVRRAEIVGKRGKEYAGRVYDRGGTLAELSASCLEETGLPPPRPQWERDPYGPHVALPYVTDWYKTMREKGDWDLQ